MKDVPLADYLRQYSGIDLGEKQFPDDSLEIEKARSASKCKQIPQEIRRKHRSYKSLRFA